MEILNALHSVTYAQTPVQQRLYLASSLDAAVGIRDHSLESAPVDVQQMAIEEACLLDEVWSSLFVLLCFVLHCLVLF